MTILLRFEVDAYLPSHGQSAIPPSNPAIIRQPHPPSGTPIRVIEENSGSRLRVVPAGYEIPHSSLVELKTFNEHKWFPTSKAIDQLWFGQVRNLKVGYHSGGTFTRIDGRDFQGNEEFERFGTKKAQGMRKMMLLMDKIRRRMKEHGSAEAILMYEEEELHLYKKEGGSHALPEDLLSRWNSPTSRS
jgi:hypothetical protein